jgi:heat shock protein HslJ
MLERSSSMKRYLLGVAVVVITLSACGQPAGLPATSSPTSALASTADAQASDQSPLANTNWQLVSFGAPRQPQPLVANSEITITFREADHVARGSAGCNSYGGTYAVGDTTLSLIDLAFTAMACDSPGVMDQEQRFQQALLSVERYRMEGDRLELVYDGGNVLRWVAVK